MLESLIQQLPTELALHILLCAAHDSVASDRAWVVELALVSRFVCELVQPVLYHTMVVTDSNQVAVEKLAGDIASARIFHSVRRLVADYSLRSWDDSDVLRLFGGVTSIDAPLEIIKVLSVSPEFRPRSLVVRYCWFAGFTDELPRTALAAVTHVAGFFPNGSQPEGTLTAEHVMHFLDAMPSLTHFGLDLLDISRFYDPPDGEDEEVREILDLDALDLALRAALCSPRIQVVALRVGGDWLSYWPDIVRIAVRLQDARVFGWHDTRPMRSWEKEAMYSTSDAWAGRTVWTEAQQLWKPST
ncbi:hypothetical protein AURDEDRAFT_129567 [Auricularia subglabra TFB-10046 SS5]|nr:hypothetical protein AURDEDRAFT_129567 [Auricularia subglabra TFB-10046 SS5]